jgi:alpha-L-arabinofuranosidase
MNKEFHVAVTGSDFADGTKEHPFRTISKAAKVAETGDKVIVHEGEYREWVKPEHSGYSNISRITYEAAEGEKVVIKGSERIQDWEPYEGTVWKVSSPIPFSANTIRTKKFLAVIGLCTSPVFTVIRARFISMAFPFMRPIPWMR